MAYEAMFATDESRQLIHYYLVDTVCMLLDWNIDNIKVYQTQLYVISSYHPRLMGTKKTEVTWIGLKGRVIKFT
jgi:hypothetical protein